jgi:8-oxo-dGTP pyrophosphatase MutT (NUDIX family)
LDVEFLKKLVALPVEAEWLQHPGRLKLLSDVPDRVPAAVLVLFRLKGSDAGPDSVEILLTRRASHLQTHAGQIAFPGGMMDPEDQHDPVCAAIRECHEEVGIQVPRQQSLGLLPSVPTVSGNFIVHPVVAWTTVGENSLTKPEQFFTLSEEVDLAEWVSVQELRQTRQIENDRPVFLWNGEKMWGVSAWIFDLIHRRCGTLGLYE